MPKIEDMTLNAKLKTYDDNSECQTMERQWLWTPKTGRDGWT